MIQVFQPSLGEEEVAAIRQVFKDNWPGRGKRAEQFEQDFAGWLHTSPDHMVSITSCTEGLFHAVKALQLHPGDEVILPGISFVGMGNAILAEGARPVFCDVDPLTLNPTPEMVEAEAGRRSAAFMLLHYGGVAPDMEAMTDMARSCELALIEDCAISEATRWNGKAAGTWGEIGIWSFDAMKSLSVGDGGMLWFRNKNRIADARVDLYLGQTSQSGHIASQHGPRWWEFDVVNPGRRSLMNDMTAAIGIVQLKKQPAMLTRRRAIHERYSAELAGLDWLRLPPVILPHSESSYTFYWVQCEKRDELATYLKENGIYTTFRYWPLHRLSIYGHRGKPLPGVDQAAAQTLLLPLHHGLSDGDVSKIIEKVRAFNG